MTLQSLVCLHRRVFLLCPPLLDYGFIDNEKCFTMCVQIKLIRHRKKKRHVEEQKKIAKDVAAMWKLPQTNQYTIRQLFTMFETFWKNLTLHACFLMRYFWVFWKHCELCIFYSRNAIQYLTGDTFRDRICCFKSSRTKTFTFSLLCCELLNLQRLPSFYDNQIID